MKLEVLNIKDNKGSSIEVADKFINREYNASLVNQVVNAYMANARAGAKKVKSRSEVSGGGKKPWAQKGSGRARAGTTRSPIWRSGGVTFTPRTNYSQKVNKKMYKAAMSVIFSQLQRDGRLKIVNDFSFETPKTKESVSFLKKLNLDDVLIVGVDLNDNFYLSTRNLYHVGVCEVNDMDPVSLIGYKNVVITESALREVEVRV
ncbi:LSU ribosomal protein L4p (L1e) [hydrothermal vent metagenome]|uniref:LSU ribosomal protein L4p (L1e) n=1 Tax=hydrothermal vent metagenome TaxID=652676 RepID=A0A1W1BKT7_9ZZZZ